MRLLGSGLRVGADKVGYQESSNTPGIVRAKRAFWRIHLKEEKGIFQLKRLAQSKQIQCKAPRKVNTRYVELD